MASRIEWKRRKGRPPLVGGPPRTIAELTRSASGIATEPALTALHPDGSYRLSPPKQKEQQ